MAWRSDHSAHVKLLVCRDCGCRVSASTLARVHDLAAAHDAAAHGSGARQASEARKHARAAR